MFTIFVFYLPVEGWLFHGRSTYLDPAMLYGLSAMAAAIACIAAVVASATALAFASFALDSFAFNLWKVTGAFAQSEWHVFKLKNTKFPTVNVVYCFKASSMAICQKPTSKSKQERHPAPTKLSVASWIQGSR